MKTIIIAAMLLLTTGSANAVLIDFEIGPLCTPPNGPTPCAPETFPETQPLTTLYSPLAVTFSGPAPGQGGAILLFGSFGLVHSGEDILAFNPKSPSIYPRFPETLTFSHLVSHVEISAESGNTCFANCALDQTFVMDAFNDSNVLVASSTISTHFFSLLAVDAPNIRSVRINRLSGINGSVFDDLSFTFQAVSEPSALWLLLVGALALWWVRHRISNLPAT